MVDYMPELGKRAFPGDYHTILEKFGKSSNSLFEDFKYNVCFTEIIMGIVY